MPQYFFLNESNQGFIFSRSLLEGSDTISIDTEMVSSQEFLCLLDMIYTGKLPLGKHNVSRIIAAADSLQMFDVAVGFKNILTCLVNQQPSGQDFAKPTATAANVTSSKAERMRCGSSVDEEQLSTDHIPEDVPLEKEESGEIPKNSGQIQRFTAALIARASLFQMNVLISSTLGNNHLILPTRS